MHLPADSHSLLLREISRTQINHSSRRLWEALKRHGQLDSLPSISSAYSNDELQLLKRKTGERASLEELATALGRPESGIVQKLASLSKEDNSQWSDDTRNNYRSQLQRKRINEMKAKRAESLKPLMKKFSRVGCMDPLAFFREHTEVYGSMNRSGLFFCHRNLYNALKDKGQLDEAIKTRNERSNKEP